MTPVSRRKSSLNVTDANAAGYCLKTLAPPKKKCALTHRVGIHFLFPFVYLFIYLSIQLGSVQLARESFSVFDSFACEKKK